ncbi:PDZ and LIM domain protein Zasp isoform X15 [Aphidius gifuensis]|uniref:PDZ and LIM domain protein Zasp isoform X15 n=1 Tax=Aphidius gifuensis TaxID=684658 RepID=UPI001CDCA642|nr:PDZ and LIM domain protein Zasp isoform X15 [Aphidius gifuensis]
MSDMAQLISVKLSRFDGSPWGFRLQGGKDFGTPLVVQKVNGGSPAEAAGLRAGDAVIKVNNTDTYNLKHKDAQDVIVKAGNSFEVTVQRGGNTWRPSVSPVTPSIPSPQPHAPVNNIPPVTKTSLAANKQDVQHIGSGHNFAPKPFSNGNSDGAPIKSIVNKQYNSPVGIYSEQTIAETLSAQAEVLAGGVLGVNFKKNEKNYDAQNSEVFRMVQEADKEPKTPEPVCSRAEYYGTISHAIGGCATSSRSATPLGRSYHGQYQQPPSSASSYAARDEYYDHLRQEQSSRASTTSDRHDNYEITVCHGCDNPIVGLFVRIKEKNLHVECFKCSTCGTSLKNVGYYNINNKLYCDIHAKLVARQQSTQGSIPTTVSTGGGKAPVGTITAALGNLGIDSPKSPPPPPQPLNGTSITAPFALQNYNRRPNSDLGNLPRGYIRPAEYITDNNNEENKKICDEKIYTSTITIKTGNETNHLGNQPNDTPTYRPLQTPTLGGGNKSIGSTGLAPTLNYSSANNNNNNNNSSSINSFIRPQSQTVTGCGLGGASPKSRRIAGNSAPTRGRGILNQAGSSGRQPLCASCNAHVRGPFITALGQIWCPEHFVCVNSQCNRPLQDIGFVQEKGQLYCEYCFERFIAPACNKCNNKIKGDSLTAIGKHFHPECFSCTYCGKLFGNSPFFLEDGLPYCEADWNELFTTKCYACGFPVEAGDRWVEALNNNYHSQCFNCSTCKANLEGQSFYAKGGRPFCKNHAR